MGLRTVGLRRRRSSTTFTTACCARRRRSVGLAFSRWFVGWWCSSSFSLSAHPHPPHPPKRWRILHHGIHGSLPVITAITHACLLLHNFVLAYQTHLGPPSASTADLECVLDFFKDHREASLATASNAAALLAAGYGSSDTGGEVVVQGVQRQRIIEACDWILFKESLGEANEQLAQTATAVGVAHEAAIASAHDDNGAE